MTCSPIVQLFVILNIATSSNEQRKDLDDAAKSAEAGFMNNLHFTNLYFLAGNCAFISQKVQPQASKGSLKIVNINFMKTYRAYSFVRVRPP